ncbi:hypothetical protein SPHINGO391_470075 [Sphingomonas aurantiaca]|uniref:Uncharacterized protein n=1 Tax=Sphingomonas aurantiaca TaxID=185949 RepID=A0A5E7ZMU8_9SPHN|nr:hypothetical protein [Sphingomonas aurantiaca]VVT20491.1 hypothetical protein SPHINGO391_470075 [Sphingomonas aurantiaca]
MRTDTTARQIERPCSFDRFLSVLNNPAPAFAVAPRTLRDHVSYRDFGDFGGVLLAERPASTELSDRVARWRTVEAREDLPLHVHPDQSADDRRHRFAFTVTSLTLASWIIIGLVAAAASGKL